MTLNVLIIGDDKVIRVDVPPDASIELVKTTIKLKQQYSFNANGIRLYEGGDYSELALYKPRDLVKKIYLLTKKYQLNMLRCRGFGEDFVHIFALVHKVRLSVQVVGECTAFTVDAHWTDSVHDLKKIVIDKVEFDGHPSRIHLYHGGSHAEVVPLRQRVIDASVRDQFLTNDKKLDPAEAISSYIELFPPTSTTHILAIVPALAPDGYRKYPVEVQEPKAKSSVVSRACTTIAAARDDKIELLAWTLSWLREYQSYGPSSPATSSTKEKHAMDMIFPIVSTVVGLLPDATVAFDESFPEIQGMFDVMLLRYTKRVCLSAQSVNTLRDKAKEMPRTCHFVVKTDPEISHVLSLATDGSQWMWCALEYDRTSCTEGVLALGVTEHGVRRDRLAKIVAKLHAALL